MKDLKNKVVWITGASSGIGEHLAYALAAAEAKLVLSSRNEKELQRVKNNCHNSASVLLLPVDVTDFDAMPGLAKKVIDHFGFLNILINNAGISQRSPARDTDLMVDKKIMEVNYFGTIALTKAVLPYFIRQQFGQIVVMSSVLGRIGVPHRSAYAASKHALHGYFDSLRAELHNDGIKVTLICPGYVQTNLPLNALLGDGSKNNKLAENSRQGIEPSVFAQKALYAVQKEKEEVVIGGKETYGVYLKRFLPKVLSKYLQNYPLK